VSYIALPVQIIATIIHTLQDCTKRVKFVSMAEPETLVSREHLLGSCTQTGQKDSPYERVNLMVLLSSCVPLATHPAPLRLEKD